MSCFLVFLRFSSRNLSEEQKAAELFKYSIQNSENKNSQAFDIKVLFCAMTAKSPALEISHLLKDFIDPDMFGF